jgi:hypothetical protein
MIFATLGQQVIAIVAVLLLALGPAFTAGWFLHRRRDAVREARRSPLTRDLLRPPGHALREQLEQLRWDAGTDLTVLVFVPLFPLAYFYLQASMTGRTSPLWVHAVVLHALFLFVGRQICVLLKRSQLMDNLRLGLDAELAVGQELDQLMRTGAAVFTTSRPTSSTSTMSASRVAACSR